jgi:hypothetical protein
MVDGGGRQRVVGVVDVGMHTVKVIQPMCQRRDGRTALGSVGGVRRAGSKAAIKTPNRAEGHRDKVRRYRSEVPREQHGRYTATWWSGMILWSGNEAMHTAHREYPDKPQGRAERRVFRGCEK